MPASFRRFVLTNSRAEQDAATLRKIYPALEIVAAPDDWHTAAPGSDGIFLGRGIPVDTVLDLAPNLVWLHSEGAGVDRILTEKLKAHPVILTNSAGVHGVPIAEHVLALMFGFARSLPLLARAQSRRDWQRPGPQERFELEGQKLAVIGLGAIGTTLARKAHALGLRVTGVSRRLRASRENFFESLYAIEQLDDALAESDHIAICLPLTPQTRNLFDEDRLRGLRAGCHIYNIGRGPIIDQVALEKLLNSGHIGGAGLDVTTPEPLPANNALWDHPRVVITNHTAGGSPLNADRTLEIIQENIERLLHGGKLRNIVNKAAGY